MGFVAQSTKIWLCLCAVERGGTAEARPRTVIATELQGHGTQLQAVNPGAQTTSPHASADGEQRAGEET